MVITSKNLCNMIKDCPLYIWVSRDLVSSIIYVIIISFVNLGQRNYFLRNDFRPRWHEWGLIQIKSDLKESPFCTARNSHSVYIFYVHFFASIYGQVCLVLVHVHCEPMVISCGIPRVQQMKLNFKITIANFIGFYENNETCNDLPNHNWIYYFGNVFFYKSCLL